jgi:hypothetical protein
MEERYIILDHCDRKTTVERVHACRNTLENIQVQKMFLFFDMFTRTFGHRAKIRGDGDKNHAIKCLTTRYYMPFSKAASPQKLYPRLAKVVN